MTLFVGIKLLVDLGMFVLRSQVFYKTFGNELKVYYRKILIFGYLTSTKSITQKIFNDANARVEQVQNI
jgi:hypothetical protein